MFRSCFTFTAVFAFLSCLFCSTMLAGQPLSGKDSVKYAKLSGKVEVAKSKVAALEYKMQVADSMVRAGDSMIFDARRQFLEISPTKEEIEKSYKVDSKQLRKNSKSKDPELAREAERELKARETQYKSDMKAYDNIMKRLMKQVSSAESIATKGEQTKMTTRHKLKGAQENLLLAGEELKQFEELLELEE